MSDGRAVYLDSWSTYRFGNGFLVNLIKSEPGIQLGENDAIYVGVNVKVVMGKDPTEVSLSDVLRRCENIGYDSSGWIKIDLYTLRVLELYYLNTGYAGMNVGEFLRRVVARREMA
jgi:hypothetical protein